MPAIALVLAACTSTSYATDKNEEHTSLPVANSTILRDLSAQPN